MKFSALIISARAERERLLHVWGVQCGRLAVSFGAFLQQELDDAEETLGCSQMQRLVTHLPAGVHIGPELEQQLCQLKGRCRGDNVRAKFSLSVITVAQMQLQRTCSLQL